MILQLLKIGHRYRENGSTEDNWNKLLRTKEIGKEVMQPMRENSNLSTKPKASQRGFLCYCRKDRRFAERLLVHFAGCQMSGLTIWDDSLIQAGSLWQNEIASALEKASFAILLVSADFLASRFITTVELPRLLNSAKSDGTRILPIIVQPCFFEGSLLASFQAVNDPARPLSCLSVPEREEIWASVVHMLTRDNRS